MDAHNNINISVRTFNGTREIATSRSLHFQDLPAELSNQLGPLVPPPEKQNVIPLGVHVPSDKRTSIGSVFNKADHAEVVVLPRRNPQPSADSDAPSPPVTARDIDTAIRQDRQRAALAGEAPPVPPPAPAASRSASMSSDLGGDALRALVEGNFEQLREYVEQLQDAMAQHGGGISGMPGFRFRMRHGDFDMAETTSAPGTDDEEDEGEDDDDDDDEDDEESEGDEDHVERTGYESHGSDEDADEELQIPEVEEYPLSEMVAMGLDERLSRNALLLHRNRLHQAVDWALEHMDDAAAREPLQDGVLRAIYAPPRAAARMARRAAATAIDPDALQSMLSMGFDEEIARFALGTTDNSLEAASYVALTIAAGLAGTTGRGVGDDRDSPRTDGTEDDVAEGTGTEDASSTADGDEERRGQWTEEERVNDDDESSAAPSLVDDCDSNSSHSGSAVALERNNLDDGRAAAGVEEDADVASHDHRDGCSVGGLCDPGAHAVYDTGIDDEEEDYVSSTSVDASTDGEGGQWEAETDDEEEDSEEEEEGGGDDGRGNQRI